MSYLMQIEQYLAALLYVTAVLNFVIVILKLQTSKAPLKSQAQGTSLFTSAASNERGVFQRIVRGRLRSGCQKVRGGPVTSERRTCHKLEEDLSQVSDLSKVSAIPPNNNIGSHQRNLYLEARPTPLRRIYASIMIHFTNYNNLIIRWHNQLLGLLI